MDNNCDGAVDENVTLTFYTDADQDGYGIPRSRLRLVQAPEGFVSTGTDCDDTNQDSIRGQKRLCDGSDNDCDEIVDEDPM